MQHIVRRHNIVIKYARLFKPSIYITLTQFQYLRKFTDTICHKFESLSIHYIYFRENDEGIL